MKPLSSLDCILFDLDDTLYPQIEFNLGCLKESAEFIADLVQESPEGVYGILKRIILSQGIEYRKIFDDFFDEIGFNGMPYIKDILKIYWDARPHISLFSGSEKVLQLLNEKCPLAMITDGYVPVQQYKIDELGIKNYFKKIYITDSYGVEHRKPSRYVFDIFLKETGFLAENCIYIGNDPRRDFLPAREVGMHTIRIRQGSFSRIFLDAEHESDVTIDRISQIMELL